METIPYILTAVLALAVYLENRAKRKLKNTLEPAERVSEARRQQIVSLQNRLSEVEKAFDNLKAEATTITHRNDYLKSKIHNTRAKVESLLTIMKEANWRNKDNRFMKKGEWPGKDEFLAAWKNND